MLRKNPDPWYCPKVVPYLHQGSSKDRQLRFSFLVEQKQDLVLTPLSYCQQRPFRTSNLHSYLVIENSHPSDIHGSHTWSLAWQNGVYPFFLRRVNKNPRFQNDLVLWDNMKKYLGIYTHISIISKFSKVIELKKLENSLVSLCTDNNMDSNLYYHLQWNIHILTFPDSVGGKRRPQMWYVSFSITSLKWQLQK